MGVEILKLWLIQLIFKITCGRYFSFEKAGVPCNLREGRGWLGQRCTTGVEGSAHIQNVPHRAIGINMKIDANLLV